MTRNKPIVITHLVLFFSSSTSSDENPCPFNRCATGGGGAVEDGVGEAVGRLGGEPSAIALGRWTPCRLAEFVEVDLSELRASPSSSTIDVQIRSKNDTRTGWRLEVVVLHRSEDLSRGAGEFVGTHRSFVAGMFVGPSEQFQRRQRTLIPRGSGLSKLWKVAHGDGGAATPDRRQVFRSGDLWWLNSSPSAALSFFFRIFSLFNSVIVNVLLSD